METILVIDNLSYTYMGQTEPSLSSINLKINRGDFVLIAGPTGCGKSTLALCMTGLIPQVIGGQMEGTVLVDKRDTRKQEVFQIAQSVGLVFQNAENQLCALSVEDEVAFGPENLGKTRDEIEKRVNFALSSTSLEELRGKYTFSLSGGQKHRTVIGATLAMLPKILVLDEPFSELDPVGCREVLETLRKLNEELGITIILIEHKLEQVLGFVKKVILLKEGKVVANGKTAFLPDSILPAAFILGPILNTQSDIVFSFSWCLRISISFLRSVLARDNSSVRSSTCFSSEAYAALRFDSAFLSSDTSRAICTLPERSPALS